jgi:acyl dehydratase
VKTHGLYYEDHHVGATYETAARTIFEADICGFVNLCGLNEPLFYDAEFIARESVFSARPVPGTLTFAMSEGLVMQTGLIHGTGMSYLGGEIRIVAPVLVNDTIRVTVTVAEKRVTRKADRGIVTYAHTVTNQRGEVVMELTVKRMIRRRPSP